MTTPILPTKAQLVAYTFSPAQLIADAQVENFLSVTNNYQFVLQLIQAFRSGTSQTSDINGVIYTSSATSFVYFGVPSDVQNLIIYLTGSLYGYLYTVSTPTYYAKVGSTPAYLTWTSVTSGVGLALTIGANSGKNCILIAWA